MIHISADPAIHGTKAKSPGQAATAAYLFVVFLGLPLILHDGYFDITETKYLFFLAASVLYILIECSLWLCRGRAVPPFARTKSLRAADTGICLFAAAYLVGALLSPGTGAWLGSAGRWQGAITIFVYVLTYFCLSRNFCFLRINAAALLLGLALAALLALWNDFSFDPLGIVSELSSRQRWQFVSTLGNTNFYSAWLGAMLPVALAWWCLSGSRIWQAVSGAALVCAFLGMLPTASESFLLALLAALWLLPPFLFHTPRALSRYFFALLVMALTLGLLRLLMRAFPTVQHLSFSLRTLSHPAALAAIAVFALTMLLLLYHKKTPLRGMRIYFIVSLVLALGVILLLVLRNTVFSELSFGAADRFLRFDGSWGTDRGRIWRYCLTAFSDLPPVRKLFGGGANYLYYFDAPHPLFPDAYLDNAHNEYLQYLLSAGIAGLVGYLTWLACSAGVVLKRAARSPLALAFMLGALAYTAQAAVNIAQPIATPYLFLLVGMATGCVIQSEREAVMPASASATCAEAE